MPTARKSPPASAATTAKKKTAKKKTARKKTTKKTASATRRGDVLGISAGPVPKRPVKSSGKKRRPKGIEITRRRTRPILPPARVRG